MPATRTLPLLALALSLSAPVFAQTWTMSPLYDAPTGSYANPQLLASDGNLYGVSSDGLFKLGPGIGYVVLDATQAPAICLEGSDGNLYGYNTSHQMVKITFGGVISVFNSAGIVQNCPVMASDGNYYGGSSTGGLYGDGYLYEITSTGAGNVFYNFTNTFDGKGPAVPPVQGSDGNLYGFTTNGWFRYSPSTGISVYPAATSQTQPPIEGADGNFYYYVSTESDNSVYRITPEGVVTNIFTSSTGTLQGLFLGGDGNLYPAESDTYSGEDCTGGSYVNVYPISLSGGGGTNGLEIGANLGAYQGISLLAGGSGAYYGNDDYYSYYYDQEYDTCTQSAWSDMVFSETNPTPTNVPLAMNLSATHILPGKNVTLTWSANSAYSATAQQCYGYGVLTGKQPLSGSLTIAPPSAGTYTASIVCGGTLANTVSVTAGNALVQLSGYQSPIYAGLGEALSAQINSIGTPAPTGNVQFKSGNLVLGSAPLTAEYPVGYAAYAYTNPIYLSTTGLPPGTYSIYVYYPGDANYGPGTSGTATITVLPPVATTTTVSPATQSLNVGSTVGLTATITGTNTYHQPRGTVKFSYGNTVLSTTTLPGNSYTETATLSSSTRGLPPGTYNVAVAYSGDPYNSPSNSTATVTLTQPSDSVTVTASANPVPPNTAFNLTATVTGVSSTPTGSVAFYAGNTALSGTSLNGSGMATVTIPAGTLAAGAYQVTADYAGDSNNPAADSPAITLTIQ